MPAAVREEFVRLFTELLRRAQEAGAVRSDLDVADVLDLVIGAAAAQRRARQRGSGADLLAVTLAGLRVAERVSSSSKGKRVR
ncbi:hypothetical protein D5S18_20855 [Nocardia panacis]|uniref:Transcriptional regulator SbtR-like C-terminal domain-containing protein n=1 Tax=Nocardia panacis TaxID=2340916 RepID=A0A3A4KKX7_9NOCA|nr:hypothetical protein [Nocardia panacis]RJO73637.1 hypothetical protein D5S18_20855 [Nocardia panacis]